MAQSTFRRRGTGSCPSAAERPDGSPVDGCHPRTTALAVSVLLMSVLGYLAATLAVSMAEDATRRPSEQTAAIQLAEYRHTAPGHPDVVGNADSNNVDGVPVDELRVDTVRQQRMAQSLIYAGGAAFVLAGSGLILVGVRRRLW